MWKLLGFVRESTKTYRNKEGGKKSKRKRETSGRELYVNPLKRHEHAQLVLHLHCYISNFPRYVPY